MNTDNTPDIREILDKIIGKKSDIGFGEPFTTLFSTFDTADAETRQAAALCCSLFLSSILAEYPTDRMHTFVRYVRDNYQTLSFDCKKYETLYTLLPSTVYGNVVLMGKNGESIVFNCSKQEIFEAFDFYTNR